MDYVDLELLRLQADRAQAALAESERAALERSQSARRTASHHGLAWTVMAALVLAIPSTSPWWG